MTERRRSAGSPQSTGTSPDARKKALWTVVALAAVVAIVWVSLAGTDGDDDGLSSEERYVPVEGFADVHGLAVDPEDPDTLYIATHHGLIRATNGTELARVGDHQHDYMGFTAHPTQSGVFWVSGHPTTGGNMGVRHSMDGGFTWEQLALGGTVDFHAMTVSPADPDVLWGFFRGQVYRSDDGGHQWQTLGAPPAGIYSFAAHPTDADRIHIATPDGLWASRDGGSTWQQHREGDHRALAIHRDAPEIWYASGPRGIDRSTDGGQNWTTTALEVDGTIGYLTLHPEDPDVLYAASYETGLYKTTDGGASWQTLKAPHR